MHPLLNLALTAARQAGEVIVRNLEFLDHLEVNTKSNNELFSEVDIKAEQAIIHTLLKAYPNHGIIAEESGSRNTDAESVWIIDPLDGTSNYIHGYPFFSVSIAFRYRGRIEHGIVFDPIRQECFTATRGSGAQLNNRKLRVSKQVHLANSLVGTGFPFRDPSLTKRYLPTFEAMIGKCAGLRRAGSAALDLVYVASGRLDGFWELGLRPWDIAAASLIVKEAGGLVGDLYGGEDYLQTGDIVAGTPKVFKALLQTFAPVIK